MNMRLVRRFGTRRCGSRVKFACGMRDYWMLCSRYLDSKERLRKYVHSLEGLQLAIVFTENTGIMGRSALQLARAEKPAIFRRPVDKNSTYSDLQSAQSVSPIS